MSTANEGVSDEAVDGVAAAHARLVSALVSARDYLLRASEDAVYDDDEPARSHLVSRAGGMTFCIDALAAALPALTAEVERLRAEVANANSVANSMQHFADVADRVERRNNELVAERDAARAAVERVRALCDEEDANPKGVVITAGHRVYHLIESGRVRTALGGDVDV